MFSRILMLMRKMKAVRYILFICCFAFAAYNTHADGSNTKQYCIVGAGPGGLQLAYFFEQAGHDYIVFEKGQGAGTFYTKFPIHRTLISINKRFTGKANKEFNMRHDWNSLLSHDESLLMTKYSKEFFPAADDLVRYLNDYVTKFGLKVQYDTTISNILKRNDGLFHMNDQKGETYTCRHVIIATGIAKPNIPKFQGYEHVIGYENVSTNLEDFEGKSVLIIGRGNSAFETAQHIMPATNVIHMMGRSRVKLAWATHYVGDLRAVNDGLLDTYQLKSLDGIFEATVEDVPVIKSKLDGRFYLRRDRATGDTSPGGDRARDIDNCSNREGYDMVIRCLGFAFDDAIFNPKMMIRRARVGNHNKKYPLIDDDFQSKDVPGLYFAGTNTHSLDFRKSAGGFIHGYRYNSRSLFRAFNWLNHGVQWPHLRFKSLLDLTPHIIKRVNEASDMYQMFGVICDMVIYNEERTNATYIESVPCSYAHKVFETTGHPVPASYMVVSLEYGKNFSGVGKDPFYEDRSRGDSYLAHQSNFLHPVLYHYNNLISRKRFNSKSSNWILPVPDRLHHLVEDFTTKFDGSNTHILSLRRFIEFNTGNDLRFFPADYCMKLALIRNNLPLGCHQGSGKSTSPVVLDSSLQHRLEGLPFYVLPFETVEL